MPFISSIIFAGRLLFGDIRFQHVDDRLQAVDRRHVGMALRLLCQALADLCQRDAELLHDVGIGVILGQGLHLRLGNFEGRRPVARSGRFLLGQAKLGKASQQADVVGVGRVGVVLQEFIVDADGLAVVFRHHRIVGFLQKFRRTPRREDPEGGQQADQGNDAPRPN